MAKQSLELSPVEGDRHAAASAGAGDPRVIYPERASALVSSLRACEEVCNRTRRAPVENIRALKAAGFFKLAQPPRFGGMDADFDVCTRVAEELAQGCASTAWVYSVLTLHHRFLALWPGEVQREVWLHDPDVLISSSLQPRAVTKVPGGYRLTGDWPFSSGCDHSDWAMIGGLVEGAPPQLLLVRLSAAEIVDDWFTLGLRGTGSKTLRFQDVFVPDAFAAPHAAIGSAKPLTAPQGDSAWDVQPIVDGSTAFASVVLGLARRGLDLVTSSLRTGVSRGVRLADVELNQMRVGEAAAVIDMARFSLHEGGRRISERLRDGETLTQAEVAMRARDVAVLVRRLREAVDSLSFCRSSWIYDSDPFQQIHRDIFTGATHFSGRWETFVLPSGKQLIQGLG